MPTDQEESIPLQAIGTNSDSDKSSDREARQLQTEASALDTDFNMDTLLRDYAPFSFYQKRLVLVCAVVVLCLAPQAAVLVFIGDAPEWKCSAVDNGAESLAPREKCELLAEEHCTPVYSEQYAKASAEFGLICGHKTDTSYAQSLFFVGMLLGSSIAGWCSDVYGRRSALLLATVCVAAGSLWSALSMSFWSFAISQCLIGIGVIVHVIGSVVLLSESVAPVHRGFVTTLMAMMFGTALSLLSPTAFLMRHNWRLLMAFLTACALAAIAMIWLWASESPFWLLAKGRHAKVETMLSRWISSSSRTAPSGLLKSLTTGKEKKLMDDDESATGSPNRAQLESTSLLPFLKPGLRRVSLSLLFSWFTVCLVYYGLALNTNGVGDNKYVSFFILSAVEIPALLCIVVTLHYIGRRTVMFWFMIATGLLTAASSFVAWYGSAKKESDSGSGASSGVENLQLALAMCGKFTSTAIFSVIYTYTPEILPTPIRTSGLGVCVVASRVGGIISPFIIDWGLTMPALPYAIFSVLAFGSCVGMLCWPETRNRDLPETIQDLRLMLNKR